MMNNCILYAYPKFSYCTSETNKFDYLLSLIRWFCLFFLVEKKDLLIFCSSKLLSAF